MSDLSIRRCRLFVSIQNIWVPSTGKACVAPAMWRVVLIVAADSYVCDLKSTKPEAVLTILYISSKPVIVVEVNHEWPTRCRSSCLTLHHQSPSTSFTRHFPRNFTLTIAHYCLEISWTQIESGHFGTLFCSPCPRSYLLVTLPRNNLSSLFSGIECPTTSFR